MNHLYPDVHCDPSVGYELQVIQSFDSVEADVAIISADSDAAKKQWRSG